MEKNCYLVLEDGTILQGQSFGAPVATEGEVGKSWKKKKKKKNKNKDHY